MPEPRALEYAALAVAQEIARLRPPRAPRSNAELLEAFTGCVLSSRVRHPVAVASVERLKTAGLFASPAHFLAGGERVVCSVLAQQPLAHPRPRQMAHWLTGGLRSLLCGSVSIRARLRAAADPRETRSWLTRECLGLGPKQASLFLRKAGVAEDLAVLDGHVIRFMQVLGLVSGQKMPSRLPEYERIEDCFARYACSLGTSVARLDAAIWIVMRVTRGRHSWRS